MKKALLTFATALLCTFSFAQTIQKGSLIGIHILTPTLKEGVKYLVVKSMRCVICARSGCIDKRSPLSPFTKLMANDHRSICNIGWCLENYFTRSNIVSYLLVVMEGSEHSGNSVSILDSKYPFHLSPRGGIIQGVIPLSSLEYAMRYLQIIIGLKS